MRRRRDRARALGLSTALSLLISAGDRAAAQIPADEPEPASVSGAATSSNTTKSTGEAGAGAGAAAAGAGKSAPATPPAGASHTVAPKDPLTATGSAAALPPAGARLPSLSHDLQFGLAILTGGGYRVIAPYENGIVCGNQNVEDARVCTNRAPFFVDLQPSFGLSEHWDALVDLRIGLEKDFTTYRQFMVMPGFRYWLDPQSHVKFFTTLQLAYDRTNQNNERVGNTDLAFRNSNGFMVEVMRNFGVYFQFGETIGFVRWLSFTVDGGVGVQARMP